MIIFLTTNSGKMSGLFTPSPLNTGWVKCIDVSSPYVWVQID